MPKEINSPNVPHEPPIENFWGWEANMEQQLIRRIESKMKEYDANFVESFLEGVKANARSIGDIGAFALFK